MMTCMNQIPATTTPAIAMRTAGHVSFTGGPSAVEAHVVFAAGQVADLADLRRAGKRGYATNRWGSSWSPSPR